MSAQGDEGFGLYVHWPFCLSKCPYCDFNSHVAHSVDQDAWRRALLTELSFFAARTPDKILTSIFFGGGTPSLMDPATTASIIEAARAAWRTVNDLEITLEANPGTVDADRFKGSFVTYGNPDNPADWGTDYQRVLTPNPNNVVNGAVFSGPFAQGRFLFGNSGYQNSGASQVTYLFTPDFDLTGRTNVHLGFKSLWEQNQDSIATLEYSINGGSSWLPIAYFINAGDLITTTNEVTGAISLDVETTLTTEYADVARYIDEEGNELGGTYGAFVAAPISPALAPYIQGRIDDNASESKRVEWFRLPEADNQATLLSHPPAVMAAKIQQRAPKPGGRR